MPSVDQIIERLREQAFYVPAEDADHVLRTHAESAIHAAADLGSPDERLREALRDANEYLAQIADYSPSEVADAIDSVRAQIKDALAATDSRGKPDGASVPDQSCATCGGSGDRNGNRRAADPFGTCPGCGGTGNVAAADRKAPDEPRGEKITHGRHCICAACAVEDWTNPAYVCGMHGKDCPREYQPLGPAGSFVPPRDEVKETTT